MLRKLNKYFVLENASMLDQIIFYGVMAVCFMVGLFCITSLIQLWWFL